MSDWNFTTSPPNLIQSFPKTSNYWWKNGIYGIEYLYNSVIATGYFSYGIQIWDFMTGSNIKTIYTRSLVICLQQLPFNLIASGLKSSQIYIWNYLTSVRICKFQGHRKQVNDLLLIDNQTLASSSLDGYVIIWKFNTGAVVFKLFHLDGVYDLEMVSFDWLASCSLDYAIRIWSFRNGSLIRTLTGHTSRIYWSLGMLNENVLVSGSLDRTVKLWNINTGELLWKNDTGMRINSLAVIFNQTSNIVTTTLATTTFKSTTYESTTTISLG